MPPAHKLHILDGAKRPFKVVLRDQHWRIQRLMFGDHAIFHHFHLLDRIIGQIRSQLVAEEEVGLAELVAV